jgi:hypothetical protein
VSSRTKFWLLTGLRFCGSCCLTVGCWALWLGLGALLAVLLYIAVAKELPVPGFVLRRAEAELAKSGLMLEFGRARFDPTGKILLEDVRVRLRPFEDPLLQCRLLYVRHDFWSLLAGWTFPTEVRLEGAALQLPAMLSPSGTAEPVVRDLALTLHQHDHVWEVDQFAGRLGRLALTLDGAYTSPARPGGTAALPLELLSARFLQTARQLAPILARLDAFERPSLSVHLESGPAEGNTATLVLTADGATRPWDRPVTLGPLVAATRLSLDHPGLRPLVVRAAARHVAYAGQVTADNLRALLHAEVLPESFSGRAVELLLAAASVDTGEGRAAAPVVRANLARWPEVGLQAATEIDGEFLAAEVEAGLAEQTARVRAAGRVAPETISRVLTRHTPRAAPFFVFGEPVRFTAEAVLAPGWHFERLAARVDAGRLDSRGVQVTSARGRIDIEGTSFLAHDARVTIGESAARGSYWMDFATTDYRMLLDGHLRPADITGWFHADWWPNFWNRFFVFTTPPAAEVDIQGRWKNPALSNNFVRARARNLTFRGADFETVDATVFVRPAFAHGLALAGTRAGGTQHLTGSFRRFAVPGGRETDRFEFDFDTTADPAVLGRMLDDQAADFPAALHFVRPPHIHAWGVFAGGPKPAPDYHFTAEAADGLSYFGFPLDTLKVRGDLQGEDLQLREIQFTAAGGEGAGKASLTGPAGARQLGFDLFVRKANLARTVHAVQEYQAARTGQPPPVGADSKFVRKAANSQLDLALSAQGNPASLASFKGTGNASLTGAQLGEIHLFGLLSQVLSSLSLSFSSLKLDAMRSTFEIRDGELYFPDLKVTGPSALIDARGKYTFATNALDFKAKFKPYEDPGSLLAAAVSLVINPLTSILELKLSGPLGDPKWSVVVGAGPKPPAAPAAAPAPATDPAVGK